MGWCIVGAVVVVVVAGVVSIAMASSVADIML